MTLNSEEKRALSEIRMNKALEFQLDAQENAAHERYRTAVNRAYYALMNAARSLLILEGLNPETHDGIVTMLSLHFIKKDLLPVSLIKSYKILLSRRTDVDYGDFDAVDKDLAETSITMSAEAVAIIQDMRNRLVKQK